MTEPDLPVRAPIGPGALLRTPAARRWAVDVAIAVAVTAAQVGGTYASASWHPHHGAVLRDVDEQAPLAPSPGLARLGDLAKNAATTGLAVRILQEGQPAPLPADVDLAAYRIVQEALTNSARHSAGANATVRVAYGADALVVEINDDGAAQPADRPSRPAARAAASPA